MLTPDDVALEVCNEFEVPLREFRNVKFRSSRHAAARRFFCLFTRDMGIDDCAERADYLGTTNRWGPTDWACECTRMMRANADGYREHYANIKARLAEPVGGVA